MQADFSVELEHNDPVLEMPWQSDDGALRYYDLQLHPDLVLQISEAILYPELGTFLSRINAPGFPLFTAKCDVWTSRDIAPEEEIFGADQKLVSYIDLLFSNEEALASFEKHEQFVQDICRLLQRAPDIAATVEFVVRRCFYHKDVGRTQSPLQAQTSECVADPAEQAKACSAGQYDRPGDVASLNPEQQVAPGSDGQSGDGQSDDAKGMSGSLMRADLLQTGFYFTVYIAGFGDAEREPQRSWAIALALVQHALIQLAGSSC